MEDAPKKEIRRMRLCGKEFLFKLEGKTHGQLYPKEGFARDLALSSALWKRGICPWTSKRGRGMLQERIRPARHLDYSGDCRRAGRALALLHTAKIEGRMLRALDKRTYLQRARKARPSARERAELARLHPQVLEKLDELLAKMQRTRIAPVEKCICHNDLVAQNFLFSGRKAFIIDFEWASRDYYEADLAGFPSPFGPVWSGQGISEKNKLEFLAAYCHARGLKLRSVLARAEKAGPFVNFIHLAWVARILLLHGKRKRKGMRRREMAELAYAQKILDCLERI